jgi:xyloglucan-specific exo-beta-1,4-glucanase
MYLSTDGGGTFTNSYEATGLPATGGGGGRGGRGGNRLVAVGGREGDLWFVGQALCHSSDGGRVFNETPNHPPIGQFSFGKAAPGKDYPSLFVATSGSGATAGLYRSDDQGATWIRINDAEHQWGNRFECIAGDPRIYGRLYVGTNGRGILYGDIAN